MKSILKKLNENGRFISRIAYDTSPTYENTTSVKIYTKQQSDFMGEELFLEFHMPMVEMREVVNGKLTNVLRHNVTNWDKYDELDGEKNV